MNRRQFVRLCALFSLTSLAAKAQVPTKRGAKKPQRIVVVGAGLAGLQAGLQLQQAGHQVSVIEARQRLGGRAWTSRAWPDLPVDLGGSWIHGAKGNPLVALAQAAGASPVPFDYDSVRRYWAEGPELTDSQDRQVDRLTERLYAALEQHEDDPKLPVAQVIAQLQRGLSAEQRRMLAYIASSEIEHNWGSPPAELSMAGYLEGDEFKGDDLLFPGQAGLMTDHLAAQLRHLGGSIQLGAALQGLQLGAAGVTVQTAQGRLSADHVVLTVPLGVLKQQLQGKQSTLSLPPFPRQWQEALQELAMGSLEKLVLRFERGFWPNENYLVRLPPLSEAGQWIDTLNLQRYMKKPALMLFNGGLEGRKSNALSDRELTESAMRALRRLYPKAPMPIAVQRSRWGHDPYTLGSYSFALGADPEQAREALHLPLGGRIWLAGEHTSVRAPQSFHGAYLEGGRVAKAITDTLA